MTIAAEPTATLTALPEMEIRISARETNRVDWKELLQYRELFYFLVWRDVKIRYQQTALGAAWAILQPLLTMLIFTIFFGKLAGVGSDGVPYPIFSYAGLL